MVTFAFAGSLLLIGLFILYISRKIVHNLYLHPLARFPGPRIAAITDLWYTIAFVGGDVHKTITRAHQKYGDVVRVAPNELSFRSPEAFQEIYPAGSMGKKPFLKSDFYQAHERPHNLLSMRNPHDHAERKKMYSRPFSATALRSQTGIITPYVDLFIRQLERFGSDDYVGIQDFYIWLIFDIIGDLTFGESFGATEQAKEHEWIRITRSFFYAGTLVNFLRALPWLWHIRRLLVPRKTMADFIEHFRRTMELIERRKDRRNDRDDFFQQVLASEKLTMDELNSDATGFIVAGSDTTATAVSTATYLLISHPPALRRLAHEIRSAFRSTSEIGEQISAVPLPFLNAIISESLRLLPPVAFGLPRHSPGATVDGHYVPAGAVVHAPIFLLHRDPRSWTDPTAFRPERWLPSAADANAFQGDKSREAFHPFLEGPRSCLGRYLAMLEMRLILAKLVWHFDLEGDGVEKDWLGECKLFTTWFKPPVMVRVKRVDGRIDG